MRKSEVLDKHKLHGGHRSVARTLGYSPNNEGLIPLGQCLATQKDLEEK